MEPRAVIWCVALCVGLLVWLYFDINSVHINYDWHSFLVDEKTGHKIKPSELLDLGKIINITESYMNSTNSIERLYDLEYNSKLENPTTLEQVYSSKQDLKLSAWPIANQSKCSEQLDWINDKLQEHKDYQLLRGKLGAELTQLMDSFGKPEMGLYSGTVTWLGSYKQCQKASLSGGQIKMGRYCQARLRPKWWSKSARPATHINMGICLPETCDTMSFDTLSAKIDALIRVDLPAFYRANLEFDSMFCLPDERSPLRQLPTSGRVYLFVVATWLALVILASIQYELCMRKARRRLKSFDMATNNVGIVDVKPTKSALHLFVAVAVAEAQDDTNQQVEKSLSSLCEQENNFMEKKKKKKMSLKFKLLETLSIHNSLKEFKANSFRASHGEQQCQFSRVRVDLGFLDFIKISMAVLIVLGHSGYLTSVYTRSMSNKIDMLLGFNFSVALSIGRIVDTFFMLFGTLMSYTLMRKFTPNQLASPLIWLFVNLSVFVRIGPVFMLVYWYSRTVSPYTGNGPWWDYGVYKYSAKGNCMNEPWWKSIPYFGCSGSPPVAPCVFPGWFIVSYSQLSLIVPLLTYLMYKLPTKSNLWRQLLVAFALAVSGAQIALKMSKQTSFKHEAFTLYGGFILNLMEKFESLGTMATLGRVGCVSVGCFVGYLLTLYEIGQIGEWPRWFANKFTAILAVGLHVVIVFLPIISKLLTSSSGHIATMNEFLSSYLITMIVWPIVNALVVVSAATSYNRLAVVRFASHSFWHAFNKLGLCIFLVHWEILSIGVTSYEQGPSMGTFTDIMKMWSFGVFFSILLAFAIHILFEAPLSALLKLAMIHVQACFWPSAEAAEAAEAAHEKRQQINCYNKQLAPASAVPS